MRINVIGTSGSGKSTLSKQLAQKLDCSYVELDALFWKPNWTESIDDEFFDKVNDVISTDRWILDGNYSRTQKYSWKRAQMVVFLDLPFHVVLWRIVVRSLSRGFKQEELWAGNKESVSRHLFTRNSMIWWVMKNFRKNRKRYSIVSKQPEYAGIQFVRLRSRREVKQFLSTLTPDTYK